MGIYTIIYIYIYIFICIKYMQYEILKNNCKIIYYIQYKMIIYIIFIMIIGIQLQ